MLVQSEHLGELDLAAEKLLTFPEGLLGFEEKTNFVMVEIEESEAYVWLQSLDDPALAFLALIPWYFFSDYEPEINAEMESDLGLEKPDDAIVLCLVTIREDDPTAITANLLGPLIINSTTRVGRQVVLAESGYGARVALVGD